MIRTAFTALTLFALPMTAIAQDKQAETGQPPKRIKSVTISATAGFDSNLTLKGPDGSVLITNDDSANRLRYIDCKYPYFSLYNDIMSFSLL